MSFLTKVKKKKIISMDGPHKGTPGGSGNPENWVTQIQNGKSSHELKKDAETLHTIVHGWLDGALEAHHVFSHLMMNGGKHFEMYSPLLMKGMSREKLQYIKEICEKMLHEAPIV